MALKELGGKCIDCGEEDYRLLEFDHQKKNKKFNVGSSMGYKLENVKEEIRKCVLRCINCHHKKTINTLYMDINSYNNSRFA